MIKKVPFVGDGLSGVSEEVLGQRVESLAEVAEYVEVMVYQQILMRIRPPGSPRRSARAKNHAADRAVPPGAPHVHRQHLRRSRPGGGTAGTGVRRRARDRAAMAPLPPISDQSLGWRNLILLPRDHYVRVDTCDYSVNPG